MNAFAFWCDKPFRPRLISEPIRRKTGFLIVRYRGSFGRSAIMTLIVMGLLAVILVALG